MSVFVLFVLMSLSPQARYQQLIDEISDHNRRYYLEGKPIISDWEYDQLFDALRQREQQHPWLISPDSPTQRLIGQVAEGFAKVAHQVPLLSLGNSYDAGDLRAFDERVRKVLAKEGISERCYRIEPKFDGISVELIYDQGVLQQAITR